MDNFTEALDVLDRYCSVDVGNNSGLVSLPSAHEVAGAVTVIVELVIASQETKSNLSRR